MATAPLVDAIDLHRIYRSEAGDVSAVRGISVRIDAGEFVAIVGPSGSGKSSLMNLLGLLDGPDRGRYRFLGREVTQLDTDEAAHLRNQMIGFVFQSFNLVPRLTAVENVEMPLAYAGVDKAERRRRAVQALEAVGMSHRCDHWPRQLSGGEQQRVAIARALVTDPALVLADEPTGAIDTQTGREILDLLQALNRAGRTIVVVTHDQSVAHRAKRVITMRDGRIISDASTDGAPNAAAESGAPQLARATFAPGVSVANVVESVTVALRALRANLMRSALTVLGIVVGVAAVITIAAIGSGARMYVSEQIRSLGTNLLLVQPGSAGSGAVRLGAGTNASLTESDAAAIEREVPGVQVAAPGVSGSAQLVRGNRNWAVLIGGVTPSYLIAREWRVERGRSFTPDEIETSAKVMLLGAATVRQLFDGEEPLGEIVRVGSVPFTVIGVLGEKGHNSDSGRDQDDVALLPLSSAKLRVLARQSQLDRFAVDYVLVKLVNDVPLEVAASRITALLRSRHRIPADAENDFLVSDPTAAIQTQATATRALSLLLSAVSAVSLVVGGIGIMNIMLVSVTERTREIGIRLAVGARRRDLLSQFAIEALTLCALGGGLGILLGGAASVAIAELAAWPVFLGPGVLALAVGSAAAVGLFFGFYPALKAARLDPIDALRFE